MKIDSIISLICVSYNYVIMLCVSMMSCHSMCYDYVLYDSYNCHSGDNVFILHHMTDGQCRCDMVQCFLDIGEIDYENRYIKLTLSISLILINQHVTL